MIRHTKYRCEININPPKRQPVQSGEPQFRSSKDTTAQFTRPVIKQFTESHNSPAISSQTIHFRHQSPVRYNSKLSQSFLQTTRDYGTATSSPSPNDLFRSRNELFQSRLQTRKPTHRSNHPSQLYCRDTYSYRLASEATSEFNLEYSPGLARSSSEQILQLRRENAGLKTHLDNLQQYECSCKAPYIQEQVQYLRWEMINHYASRCQEIIGQIRRL